jgi:integrase
MARQQLPPQIKKIKVADRTTGKPVVRYQVTVDTGINLQTGRRQQARRRYATEREARTALGEIIDATAKGQFISRSTLTVEQLCSDYLASRHKLRASSKAKLEYDLAPLRERHGQLPLQRLTKGQIDALVRDLIAGGTTTGKGHQRRRGRQSPSIRSSRASSRYWPTPKLRAS